MSWQTKWRSAKTEFQKTGARGVAIRTFDTLDSSLDLRRALRIVPPVYSRARRLAEIDRNEALSHPGRRFAAGTRPVIRWCKGDGLDDDVTRSAIAQATRLFGDEVDYCLCTNGIDARRARDVLSWATQPVEWWPVTINDNPELARALATAACPPERYGYWWKWFPFRTRPHAPEWILDGDMVITGRPSWFDAWKKGEDGVRLSQETWNPVIYGTYGDLADPDLSLNSGLASLSPDDRMGEEIISVLTERPLAYRHDGRRDMCEQGVIAAAFQRLDVTPIPLEEFPFACPAASSLDHGQTGVPGHEWGYHFLRTFVQDNPWFHQLAADGTVFSLTGEPPMGGFAWLGGTGQWGIPGWSMGEPVADMVVETARSFAGQRVLELGTSRGRLTALLASAGCQVTTVDHQDRGAAKNLEGLSVTVVVDDAVNFLQTTDQMFDLIVVDFHGNSVPEWQARADAILRPLSAGGTLIINNTQLYKQGPWVHERGARWFVDRHKTGWAVREYDISPGLAIMRRTA
jgi:protein-L-isoaspartate O-methyltransferase